MARVPLYKAAETEMIRRIRAGEWKVGLRLPNEFGLAEEFGVSQGTMRRALMTLEGMGLLSRKPGRGTIVAASGPTGGARQQGGNGPAAAPIGFDRLRHGADEAPELTVFRARAGTRGADPAEMTLFGTGRLSVLERTLKRGGDRFALDEIAAPEARIPAFDEDGPADLVALLAAEGITVGSIRDRISAAVTSMAQSVALSVDRHTALLVLTRVAHDADGQIVARQIQRMVADDIAYAVTLSG